MEGMENERENIDAEKAEVKKPKKKNSLRDFLDGSLLTRDIVMKQIPFIIFLSFLAVLYIWNGNVGEQIVRETVRTKRQLKDLRCKSISIASKLMYKSNQSEVVKLIDAKGLGFKLSKKPPTKIVVPKGREFK